MSQDMVNHPSHYGKHPVFSRECIEYTQYMSFTHGNAFKYLYRQGQKFDAVQDVEKALWYIQYDTTRGNIPEPLPDFLVKEMEEEWEEYCKSHDDKNDMTYITSEIMVSLASVDLYLQPYKSIREELLNDLKKSAGIL